LGISLLTFDPKLGFVRNLFIGFVLAASACTRPGLPVDGPIVVRSHASEVVAPPASMLTMAQARQYMLALINRDRASMGLAAVHYDEGPPTRAGQGHAEDMARRGYLGHYGLDGSVPEQRLTEAGGADMVLENASCYVDEKARTLDASPRIDPRNIERAEAMFFDEQPPHDGHRRNILGAWHTHVGIGIAQPVALPVEIPVPCIAQEFVDAYGSYDSIPRTASIGAPLRVRGTVSSPARFAAVALARAKMPVPLSVGEANRRRTYPVPNPQHVYWPDGAEAGVALRVEGSHFDVRVAGSEIRQAGLYEVSVWAHMPGEKEAAMVGLRTVLVR
jgi:uncharacterized protein YkwD